MCPVPLPYFCKPLCTCNCHGNNLNPTHWVVFGFSGTLTFLGLPIYSSFSSSLFMSLAKSNLIVVSISTTCLVSYMQKNTYEWVKKYIHTANHELSRYELRDNDVIGEDIDFNIQTFKSFIQSPNHTESK